MISLKIYSLFAALFKNLKKNYITWCGFGIKALMLATCCNVDNLAALYNGDSNKDNDSSAAT